MCNVRFILIDAVGSLYNLFSFSRSFDANIFKGLSYLKMSRYNIIMVSLRRFLVKEILISCVGNLIQLEIDLI